MRFAEERSIEPGSQVAGRREVAGGAARDRHEGQQSPVAHDQHACSREDDAQTDRIRPCGDRSKHEGGDEVAEGQTRQHAHHAHRCEVKGGVQRQAKANRVQQCSAAGDHGERSSAAIRQDDRDAHDEDEEREDEVGRRPPVPVGVQERRVDVAPVAGCVHDHHGRHRHATEHVYGCQAERRNWLGHASRVSIIVPCPPPPVPLRSSRAGVWSPLSSPDKLRRLAPRRFRRPRATSPPFLALLSGTSPSPSAQPGAR